MPLYSKLILQTPDFNSPLTDDIFALEQLHFSTHDNMLRPELSSQLKHIFHRIESFYICSEKKDPESLLDHFQNKKKNSAIAAQVQSNMENAFKHIDDHLNKLVINKDFVCDIHWILMQGISASAQAGGDQSPGKYRTKSISVPNSTHIPPLPRDVEWYMEEMFDFINKKLSPKAAFLKIAICLHRFSWIHPFNNGNHRLLCVLCYALFMHFYKDATWLYFISPNAIFSPQHDDFNKVLAVADDGARESILSFCTFLIMNLQAHMQNMFTFANHSSFLQNIISPSIQNLVMQNILTKNEAAILLRAGEKQIIKALDLKDLFPKKHPADISHMLSKLKDANFLKTIEKNGRKYYLSLDNSYLLPEIVSRISIYA